MKEEGHKPREVSSHKAEKNKEMDVPPEPAKRSAFLVTPQF